MKLGELRKTLHEQLDALLDRAGTDDQDALDCGVTTTLKHDVRETVLNDHAQAFYAGPMIVSHSHGIVFKVRLDHAPVLRPGPRPHQEET